MISLMSLPAEGQVSVFSDQGPLQHAGHQLDFDLGERRARALRADERPSDVESPLGQRRRG